MFYRKAKGKEHATRYIERFAQTSLKRPDGKLIWFHVASVGELRAILPIVDLCINDEELRSSTILVTTMTLTASQLFVQLNLTRVIHQFVPLDSPSIVRRFLEHWKPSCAIFAESEIWPNLIFEASKRCNVALINATISNSSYNKWSLISSTAKEVFGLFSLIAPASNRSAQRIKKFTVRPLEKPINLKFFAKPLPYDEKLLRRLQELFQNRNVLLCASTHYGEESKLLRAFSIIRKQVPDVAFIIVLRHPHRAKAVSDLIRAERLTYTLKSADSNFEKAGDVYIVDTIGELGTFYRLCKLVFVGGSLVKVGGHNILEPAMLECCIITGRYFHNFEEIVSTFQESEAIVTVNNHKELAAQVIELLNAPLLMDKYSHNASQLMTVEHQIIGDLFLKLKQLIT
ncbi:3-deoxy-D-manno-octulosonic acid transferase [Rickettsiales endosymbiont of Peranema trichophorum]|uniref:3-deoxy-D-manno-octulosonic acid transferase n=1 Tax=Rickettsiales endosymbiont of Peranema trichophorum TaxID=2486577 RepID=UPI0013EEE238|nr:3-deoxy-D-manno-octulosonic acid transferase [Rickettsiales endosymbiont of Peranema trichophorum]